MLTPLQPLVAQGLLPMLGYWPADDLAIVSQSGPAFTLAQARLLSTQRIAGTVLALQSWAPLIELLLSDKVSIDEIIQGINDKYWQDYASHSLETFLGLVSKQSVDRDALTLSDALMHWQSTIETQWPLIAVQTLPPIALIQVQYDVWVSAGHPSRRAIAWAEDLGRLFLAAGKLSARITSLVIAPQTQRRQHIHGARCGDLYAYDGPSENPILMVFATVNRPDVMDLDTAHSLVHRLQMNGFKPYLLDWGNSATQVQGFNDYSEAIVDEFLPAVCSHSGLTRIALMGICQGGVMALQAAQRAKESISSLHLLVTPLRFDSGQDFLSRWANLFHAHARIEQKNVLSPGAINLWFQYLRPYRLRIGKYLTWLRSDISEPMLALNVMMEHWLMSGPELSGVALAQYQQEVVEKNELMPLFKQVMEKIPIQVLIAEHDHIVPLSACTPSMPVSDTVDIQTINTGHIGLLMGKSHPFVAQNIAEFARRHTTSRLKTATVASAR